MIGGKLDRYIDIEKYTTTTDDFGGRNETWASFHPCFAQVMRSRGGEKYEQSRETATNIKLFKIRYFAGILPTMRISYDGGYYYITNIDEAGREGLIITAELKV